MNSVSKLTSVAAVLTILAAFAPIHHAQAAAPTVNKAEQALTLAAQKQLDAGNFERAADLFLEIWHMDKSAFIALFNAARSTQLAGNVDKAEPLFQEFLALPNLPPEARTKAQTQLEAVRKKRAERRADEATKAESAGQHEVAAQMWIDAIALDATKPEWLRHLGRSLHLAGKKPQAISAYDQYLNSEAASGPERTQVAAWRKELTPMPVAKVEPPVVKTEPPPSPKPAVVKVEPKPTPIVQTTRQPTVEQPSALPPLLTAGAGVVVAVIGAVLLTQANSDRDALDNQTNGAVARGEKISLAYPDATQQAADIASRRTTAAVVLGAGGALAIGGGVWWLLRGGGESSAVMVVPAAGGGQVSWAVAW